jgi:predicted Zn-dependent protease
MTLIHRFRILKSFALTFSLVIGATVFAGCATDRAVISQANQVHDGIKPAVMDDPQLTSYLQTVGDRIIAAARELDKENFGPASHRSEESAWMFSKDMKFHFVNSKTLNAFTTGGEHMYIYNELFQKCRSEDELAAVMAHEYGHVYARHVQKAMNRQYAILGGAAAAGVAGYAAGGKEHGAQYGATFATAALAAGQFIGMGYTRKDEAQADELGFNFYTRAGWDPKRFGDFFQQMIDMGYDTTPALASDHPTLASRVEEAKKNATKLPPDADKWRKPPVANEKKFKQLQARAAELGKTLPTDKSLEGAQKLLAAFGNCFMPTEQPEQVEARAELAGQKSTKSRPKRERR